MKDERILFIGGPKDGLREAIPQATVYHQLQVPHYVQRNLGSLNSPMPAFGITTHTFTIKRFVAEDGTELKIAVHSSVKDVMKQLVKGYHYHRKPRRKYGW